MGQNVKCQAFDVIEIGIAGIAIVAIGIGCVDLKAKGPLDAGFERQIKVGRIDDAGVDDQGAAAQEDRVIEKGFGVRCRERQFVVRALARVAQRGQGIFEVEVVRR